VCAVCKYDYCGSKLNVNMHLLISLAQKQIQYPSKLIKAEMHNTQTCNNYAFNLTLFSNVFADPVESYYISKNNI